ncbi:hypothetical protein GIB67_004829 [Kingdonia uniflora]|uniref:HAT C-terminal dimerisation domain-containing protein n=1 Tax=Kingdonia uniflora TaxID=39325 RepID=A0A7J7LNC8_9MAGN|nr:hypothetical protein GIB67_004829 [Kingdonia uniflora]
MSTQNRKRKATSSSQDVSIESPLWKYVVKVPKEGGKGGERRKVKEEYGRFAGCMASFANVESQRDKNTEDGVAWWNNYGASTSLLAKLADSVRQIEELLQFANIVPAVNQVELHPFWSQDELVNSAS